MLLDVSSGSIFSLDERVHRYLQVVLANPSLGDAAIRSLLVGLDAETISDIESELEQLIASACLFTQAVRPTEDGSVLTLKSLCLNVAHECNFACTYCFAHGGDYHGEVTLMTQEVARAGIDFLVRESGFHRNVEVDFFGGEPLMNW
ncbi:MAG: 4Fe-4S cluster-binding domain-containing protein, partial [Caldiserica bacterium]|nr:4Fe-4S cluster-binding domain-containing protein [Caldisericota bacterium]